MSYDDRIEVTDEDARKYKTFQSETIFHVLGFFTSVFAALLFSMPVGFVMIAAIVLLHGSEDLKLIPIVGVVGVWVYMAYLTFNLYPFLSMILLVAAAVVAHHGYRGSTFYRKNVN